MSYYNGDDIAEALGTNQLNSDDDDVMSALNGDYDDINDEPDDELESFMDADEDREYIDDTPPNEEEVVRAIIEESQGVTDEGFPRAAISLSLDMITAGLTTKQTLAQQAMYKPIITINKRVEFVEFLFDFPTHLDANLKILLANLSKYGDHVNRLNAQSESVPLLSFTIVPLSGLGSYYMVAVNPVMWALEAKTPNDLPTRMKILIRGEDVGFFQTDEIDLRDIEAAIQREQANEMDALYDMEQKDKQAQQQTYLQDLFGEGE